MFKRFNPIFLQVGHKIRSYFNIILPLHTGRGVPAISCGTGCTWRITFAHTCNLALSDTDDGDEQGFRIYGVVGRLDDPLPELRLQLGVYGHFAPVEWPLVFSGPAPGVRLISEGPASTTSTDRTTRR